MKKIGKILFIFTLLIIYIYILAISSIPNSTILFQGESFNIKKIFGISLQTKEEGYEAILASSNLSENKNEKNKNIESIGTTTVDVKLFNTITVKTVNVSVIERTKVIPIGAVAGLKLYTSGVLVVGMSEIKGEDNQNHKPYENSGIKEGDMIVSIEQKSITTTSELINVVNSSQGKSLDIKYIRDGESLECSITPVKTSSSEYKLGLWVRDSAAGIGTITYYEPSTGKFGALGHGITDIDTNELIYISNGEFLTSKILSIVKGLKGKPGKIQGSIENGTNIGSIYKNSNLGIYGNIKDLSSLKLSSYEEKDVALRNEIQTGKATVLCNLDGDKIEKYEIELEKIYINNDYDNKSMLIKVTDENLLEKTGGIIQGMSGSPIIQNGKFIGAVTNVLVNDPTQGYAVFGDLMIKEMREVE